MNPVSHRWFFLGLGILGVAAAAVPWGYAVKRQVTLEDCERARAAWETAGLKDYDLKVRHGGEAGMSEATARIRGGVVREVVRDGLFGNPEEAEITVEGIFVKLESILARKQRQDFLLADFHPGLGYPVRLVWGPRGGGREEWMVRLDAIPSR